MMILTLIFIINRSLNAGAFNKEMSKMSSLRTLIVSSNHLNGFPPAFITLPSLRNLDLTNCSIKI